MTNENIEHKVEVTFTTGEATNEYLKNKIIPIIMNEEQFDIKDDRRTYYYNIYGKMEPDYESMAAYLLDEGILFVSSAISKHNGKDCLALYVLIDDYFVPASDGEEVTYDELPKLYELYKERKHDGVSQFVAEGIRGLSTPTDSAEDPIFLSLTRGGVEDIIAPPLGEHSSATLRRLGYVP